MGSNSFSCNVASNKIIISANSSIVFVSNLCTASKDGIQEDDKEGMPSLLPKGLIKNKNGDIEKRMKAESTVVELIWKKIRFEFVKF